MKSRDGIVWLVLALTMLGSLPALSAPAAPSDTGRPEACALLDDPGLRARLSGAFELALLRACGRYAPGAASAASRPVPAVRPQVGVDVRVNAIDPAVHTTTQSETSIAVNAETGAICSTYNDSYHYLVQGLGYCGFSRSVDGGQTFTDGGVMPGGGGGVSRGDPSVVWRASDGDFYFTCIHESSSYGLGLWRSTDDCATFQWVGLAHAGSSDDKEMMAVDNSPASPYYGRLYVAWTDFGAGGRIGLVRSDNGTTWSAPVYLTSATASVQGAWPAVAPNGDVYVAWLRWLSGSLMSMEVARSTNGGVSFSQVTSPRSNVTVPRDAGATSWCSRDALNGHIRYLPSPQITVGPDGCLHAVYSYDPDGYNMGDVVNAYYRRSCDNGTTWGTEVRLNDDATLTDQFFPAVAVNQDNLVAASWYDRRLDPAGNMLFDRYSVYSYDGGLTWSANERVSDVSSPVYVDPNMSTCYHGDYDQLAADSASVYIQWSDDRVLFNGHQDPDVYFDRKMLPPDFSLDVTPASHTVCRPTVVTSTVELSPMGSFSAPVTLSDADLPAGVSTSFAPNPVPELPGDAVYTITVGAEAVDGAYQWPVSGVGATQTHSVTVALEITGTAPASTTLLSPPDGAVDVPVHGVSLSWAEVPGAARYRLVVDDDPGWTSPLVDTTLALTQSYTLAGPLAYGAEYYWQVTAENGCGSGSGSAVFSFTTQRHRVYLPLALRDG